MKFITEIDLWDLYRKEPFTTYDIEPGTRLTPGARQFLIDRGIKKFDDGSYAKKKQPSVLPESENNWKKKKLYTKMKSMEALFLITEEELLSRDALLAQRVINLGRRFTNIRKALEGKGSIENLSCEECTGINSNNFSYDLDDCFDITDFHMQLERGRDIIILHKLRSALREIEPAVLELYEDSRYENEKELCKDVIEKVNQIINTLSQIICCIFGGKTCQRKS